MTEDHRMIIVGLGNPGAEYSRTRHNLGFMVLEALARDHHMTFKPSRVCKGLVAEGAVFDKKCLLLMPLTFMNQSGVAVKSLSSYYQVPSERILIVCDDFHLPFGQCRLRPQGSDGGHNGLSSVIQHLSSEAFVRLRMGVGAPPAGWEAADYVLSEFSQEEKKDLEIFVKKGIACCELWLKEDISKVMSQFNKRKGNG